MCLSSNKESVLAGILETMIQLLVWDVTSQCSAPVRKHSKAKIPMSFQIPTKPKHHMNICAQPDLVLFPISIKSLLKKLVRSGYWEGEKAVRRLHLVHHIQSCKQSAEPLTNKRRSPIGAGLAFAKTSPDPYSSPLCSAFIVKIPSSPD